jgi:hypothetical protein
MGVVLHLHLGVKAGGHSFDVLLHVVVHRLRQRYGLGREKLRGQANESVECCKSGHDTHQGVGPADALKKNDP